jgi:hypothetical protein
VSEPGTAARVRGWGAAVVHRLRGPDAAPRARDAVLVALAALLVRGFVIAFAAGRFPPADDGSFYHVVAGRIARGLGYTWAWPDGTVTYAAHYPVGYPALLALPYRLVAAEPGVAMCFNAVLGATAAWAAHALAGRVASRRGAVLAGLMVAFEPALVFYTPALMTEAVAGELLLFAAAVATSETPRFGWRAGLTGLLLGVALLVRPQLILVAPVVGALLAWRAPTTRALLHGALVVTALSLATCVPWTVRNCSRLDTCAFVSANGGWNLYIGASPLGEGGWAPLEQIGVPEECRTVFAEGEKDRCFGRAGLAVIAKAPLRWLALAPKKLGATFDYGTAAAHYLAASNPDLVQHDAKVAIGAAELLGQRVLTIAAAVALGSVTGPRRRARRSVALVAVLALLMPSAWLGWVALVVLGLLLGREIFRLPAACLAVSVVGASALTHAVFFGAGRYALVCLPSLAAVTGLLFTRPGPGRD